jgi:hypothetical protein
MRNYRGYDYNSGYPETELSFVDIKNILKNLHNGKAPLASANVSAIIASSTKQKTTK